MRVENFLGFESSSIENMIPQCAAFYQRTVGSRGFIMSAGHAAMVEVNFRQTRSAQEGKKFPFEVKPGTSRTRAYCASARFYTSMSLFDVR